MGLHRSLTAIALLISSVLAEGQELAVRVHPEKPTSPLGEAVFVLVELTNISPSIVEFADDGECAQSFKRVVFIKHRTQENRMAALEEGPGAPALVALWCSSRARSCRAATSYRTDWSPTTSEILITLCKGRSDSTRGTVPMR